VHQKRILRESKSYSVESLFSETIISIPPIEIRISLSNLLPEIHESTLEDELEDLAARHLTRYYNSYSPNESEFVTSFNQFFLKISIENSHDKDKRNLQRNKLYRQLKNGSGSNHQLVSVINAELNGYALFDNNITKYERKIMHDLPAQAFIGLKHAEFLREIQSSKNEVLSSAVQISITSQSDTKANERHSIGEASTEKSKSTEIQVYLVLSCFFVGILVGALFVYKFSYVLDRQDGETDVNSNGSINGVPSKTKEFMEIEMTPLKFLSRFLSRDRKPTLINDDSNEIGFEECIENNDFFTRTGKRPEKRRPKKKRSKKRKEKKRNSLTTLTSIEEESDSVLYDDIVDDMVMYQVNKRGSLFPTLQDRLSNTKAIRFFRQSNIKREFNDSYSPTKCKIPDENMISAKEKQKVIPVSMPSDYIDGDEEEMEMDNDDHIIV